MLTNEQRAKLRGLISAARAAKAAANIAVQRYMRERPASDKKVQAALDAEAVAWKALDDYITEEL